MPLIDRKSVLAQKWIGLTLILSIILVFGERLAWHKYMGRLRGRGALTYRALILGANEEAARAGAALLVSATETTAGPTLVAEASTAQRLYTERFTALATGEQCLLCHGSGRVADIKEMHAK